MIIKNHGQKNFLITKENFIIIHHHNFVWQHDMSPPIDGVWT